MKKKKVLIFIVAYNAERTIEWVLDRIPDQVFTDERYDMEVLVIDDCSQDRTFEVGTAYKRRNTNIPLTMLVNPVNLGYGGNQKLGYRFAIEQGFDCVALIHGDGQYAPEELPNLLEPLLNEECGAVFGSRMMTPGAALEGGMPMYKYIGNKILTWIENTVVGTELSEYHSGYRLYSVHALAKVPFEYNSNDFDFDTDIIIQIHSAGERIAELPIPTFYGDEICHVNGVSYACKIVSSCLKSRLQRYGIFYDPKFDFDLKNDQYVPKYDFPSSHSMALETVSEKERVLSLGSGAAELIRPFFEKGCALITVDLYTDDELQSYSEECFETDLEEFSLKDIRSEADFDKILALDIIEHLRNPEDTLQKFREDRRFHGSRIVLTTPNIAFFAIRLMLMLGFFQYGKRGILDKTHTRLFTFGSLRRMLEQNGYKIHRLEGVPAPFPLAFGRGGLSNFFLACNQAMIRIARSLFSYQIYCEAEVSPTTEALLNDAHAHSDERRKDPRPQVEDSEVRVS